MQNCRIRRWRMADHSGIPHVVSYFIIVFMAHNTLSKGDLRLAFRKSLWDALRRNPDDCHRYRYGQNGQFE